MKGIGYGMSHLLSVPPILAPFHPSHVILMARPNSAEPLAFKSQKGDLPLHCAEQGGASLVVKSDDDTSCWQVRSILHRGTPATNGRKSFDHTEHMSKCLTGKCTNKIKCPKSAAKLTSTHAHIYQTADSYKCWYHANTFCKQLHLHECNASRSGNVDSNP